MSVMAERNPLLEVLVEAARAIAERKRRERQERRDQLRVAKPDETEAA